MDIVYGSKKYTDSAGQRIDFKEPYFDIAFGRRFGSVEEKAHFMNSRNLVQNGDSDAKRKKQLREHEIKQKDLKCRMV